jgi:hypothetical protein
MPAPIATQDALHALFHPRAVAVIGASDDTTKHGYIVLTNLRATGFTGGIYGISRRLTAIDGIPLLSRPGVGAGAGGYRFPRHPGRGGRAGGARLCPRRAEDRDRRLRRLRRKPRCRRRRTPARVATHCPRRRHPHRRTELQRHLQCPPAALHRLQHRARQAADAGRDIHLLSQRRVVRRHDRAPGHARRRTVAVRLRRQRGRPIGARHHGIRHRPRPHPRHRPADRQSRRRPALPSPGARGPCGGQARGGPENRRVGGGRGRRGGAFLTPCRR